MGSPLRMFASTPFLSTPSPIVFKIPLLPDSNKGILMFNVRHAGSFNILAQGDFYL
jgi:hypothetical protein